MINYHEATDLLQDMTLYFIKNSNKEIKGKFCNGRIRKESLPDGLYSYEFRGGDNKYLCVLEPNVLVNFEGTFICNKDIEFGNKGYLTILDYEESNMAEADLDYSFI